MEKLSIFFCKFLNIDLRKKPRLVRDKSKNKEDLKHSFSDIPDKAISLINLETIKDFENKIKKNINFLRFRGNFNFVGGKPWEEFGWVGKKIKIGNFKLFELLIKKLPIVTRWQNRLLKFYCNVKYFSQLLKRLESNLDIDPFVVSADHKIYLKMKRLFLFIILWC